MVTVRPCMPRRASLSLQLFAAFWSLPSLGVAQFGGAMVIDDEPTSVGVTAMATTDVNNDGTSDLITANGYNQGRIALYLNNAGTLFDAEPVLIDLDAPFAEDVCAADLDQDGLVDLIAITRFEGEVFWYRNVNGAFPQRVVLDSTLIMLNAVVAGDMDADDDQDLVVIGQHSIHLFRNDGNAGFIREAILTTATSPLPLECMDLMVLDIDGDGDLDPVTAETIGPVIYLNAGDGTFTPTLVDAQAAIQAQLDVDDLDGDGDLDIVVVSFIGAARWYRNDGMTWANAGVLLPGGTIRNFDLFDADGDGLSDAISARGAQVLFHQGLGDGGFAADVVVHTFGSTILDELGTEDMNNDGLPDVIWSAPGGTIAYHLAGGATVVAQGAAPHPSCTLQNAGQQRQLMSHLPAELPVRWQLTDLAGRSSWYSTTGSQAFDVPAHAMCAGLYTATAHSTQGRCTVRFVLP